MEEVLKDLILRKIDDEKLEAFTCYDFLDLGLYKTISKCLERMEDKNVIRRILPGVYDLNVEDKYFGIVPSPNVDAVAHAIAREYMWNICPTGSMLINIFGLSSQVSSSFVYLSSGPYREYHLGNVVLKFKHTSNREISNYDIKTLMLIQVIKEIQEINMSDLIIQKLKLSLTKEEKNRALSQTKFVTTWIRNFIVKICKEE